MTLGCRGRLRACALLALLCALVVPEAHAQGTVTGRVTAAGSSEPLPKARVIAIGTPSSDRMASSSSNTSRLVKWWSR
jgi:hypothetical protein